MDADLQCCSMQGDARPSKRPRLKQTRSPRSMLLLNVTSAAQEAAAAAASLSPMATPVWTGFGTPAPSAEADELAGTEPVLQRDVVPSSLSAKAGRPVAIERVRLICRSLQTEGDQPMEADTPAAGLSETAAPAHDGGQRAGPLQACNGGLPAAATFDHEPASGKVLEAAEGGAVTEGARCGFAGMGVGGGPGAETALQQRQKLMERMQQRLAGLSLPPPLASPISQVNNDVLQKMNNHLGL